MEINWGTLFTNTFASGWGEFGALLLFVFTAYLLGRVIPKSTHERELELVKELAKEREKQADEWKEVATKTNEMVEQMVPQLDVIVKFFSEVPVTPKSGDKRSEPEDATA